METDSFTDFLDGTVSFSEKGYQFFTVKQIKKEIERSTGVQRSTQMIYTYLRNFEEALKILPKQPCVYHVGVLYLIHGWIMGRYKHKEEYIEKEGNSILASVLRDPDGALIAWRKKYPPLDFTVEK
jgi:hypothetical protein